MLKNSNPFPKCSPLEALFNDVRSSTTSSFSGSNTIFTKIYNDLFKAGHGIWLWEPATGALHFNKAYTDMLGYEEQAFPYNISTWENLIHPKDRENIISAQRDVLKSSALGDSFESRYRLRMKNGHYRWVIGKGYVIHRDAQDQAVIVAGIHVDLPAMDSQLKQHIIQHDRMLFALEAANDGLWDWDSQGKGVYYSPRYIEMLGYTPANFPPVFESWASRVHPDDLASTVEMQLLIASSPTYGDIFECTYRFLAADGSYKWILGRGKVTRRDDSGRAARIVGLHTDITELRNTQEALAQMVNTDPLTHLSSRFYFEGEMAKLRPSHHPISLIYCDIDCLKLVNDHIGHCAGDALLVTAGQFIRSAIRSTDIAARLGGDEFVILLTRCPEQAARKVLENLRRALNNYNKTSNIMPIFISMGLVSTDENVPQHKLVAQADKIMMVDKALHHPAHLIAMKTWIENKLHTCIDETDMRL
ncbi:MAG: PAS domain-containing protein [Desulfovibrionaceae bacterium]